MAKPGPKKKPDSQKRQRRMEVVLLRDEWKSIEAAARKEAKGPSVFVREAAVDAARRVLGESD